MQKGKCYSIDDYIITRNGQVINKHNGHIVKPQKNGKGYLRVCIGKKLMFVHRLVAEKHISNPENKPQINHIDGNKENNSVENLEFVTNQENRNHAVKNGLHRYGEKCSYSKLKEKDVIYILDNANLSNKELSKKFNVSPSTICDIKSGRTWKHLKRYAEL